MAFTLPLMVAVHLISARIGRVTGQGLAANLGRVFPRWAVTTLVGLLRLADTIDIGADIAAMGATARLVVGGDAAAFTVGFALVSLGLRLFVPHHRQVHLLKSLTLALFAYVAVVFTVKIDWPDVLAHTVMPHLRLSSASLTVIVAVFGATISPYLFFWQSSEEVENLEAEHEPAAVTLHAAGAIQTSVQAAEALRPIAGRLAFLLFSLGVIGTGLLAAPVLAGSAAYAVGASRGWKIGLEHQPWEAPGFCGGDRRRHADRPGGGVLAARSDQALAGPAPP